MACTLPLSPAPTDNIPQSDNTMMGAEFKRLNQVPYKRDWQINYSFNDVITIANYKFRNHPLKDCVIKNITACLKRYQKDGGIVINDSQNKQNKQVTEATQLFFSKDIFKQVSLGYWDYKDLLAKP